MSVSVMLVLHRRKVAVHLQHCSQHNHHWRQQRRKMTYIYIYKITNINAAAQKTRSLSLRRDPKLPSIVSCAVPAPLSAL